MLESVRLLTEDEIEQVAGVYDGCGGMWPPEYYTTIIYVTYTPPPQFGAAWTNSMSVADYMNNYYLNPYAQASYDPPTGGGGGGGEEPTARATPGVETQFVSGASLEAANNAALAAGNDMLNKSDSIEHSAIVYYKDGVVGKTTTFDSDDPQDPSARVNWLGKLGEVPAGAVIIGIVHSHPADVGLNTEGIPSNGPGEDWDAYNQLLQLGDNGSLGRNITVDDNMLLYIATPRDNQIRVYDNTDRNTGNLSSDRL